MSDADPLKNESGSSSEKKSSDPVVSAARITRLGAIIVAVLTLAGGIIAAVINSLNQPSKSTNESITPTSAPPISATTPGTQPTISTPASSGASAKLITTPTRYATVPRCITVKGRGAPASGDTWRVGVHTFNPETYYLPREAQKISGENVQWLAAPVYVGAAGDFDAPFEVVLYRVPPDKQEKYANPQFVAAKHLLRDLKDDGVSIIDAVPVKRLGTPDTSC
ncbi:hypothetical protein [Amycolatopsis sp. NPDC098790]|uniref:hypothetical protein n=1 Tax=Amycolatopsis sp. NPDC098790 TaxID=3363939 RepID=UPI00380B30E7